MISPFESKILHEEGVFSLWDIKVRGDGVTIGVLDTGIRPDDPHKRLIAQVDLTGEGELGDPLGHGTVVAKQILQYAPNSKLVSIRVVNHEGIVTRESLMRGLDFCVEKYPEIRLVNISISIRRRFWFWSRCSMKRPCKLCKAVNVLSDKGLLAVAAAGNFGPGEDTMGCPGMAVGCFSVAAMEDSLFWTSGEYLRGKVNTGTSVAAARCTGGIALLLTAFPDLKLAELREAFDATAIPIPGPPNATGSGQGQFYKAYQFLSQRRQFPGSTNQSKEKR